VLNLRTIHQTTDSSQKYSNRAKSDLFKDEKTTLPQPAPFKNPNSQTPGTSSIVPTPVHPATLVYDPFSFSSSMTNGLSMTSTSPLNPSFTRSPTDHENNLLDPQLLALQPSPQHMLPGTPFTNADRTHLASMNDDSPESLPMPSPFTWNDFTFFDELNISLGVLNPTDDMQSQIDRLMSNMLTSGAPTSTAWPSAPDVNNLPDIPETSATLFRIPTSNEVPIKGVHSAPPPTRHLDQKFDEAAWKQISAQIKEAEKVVFITR
jgi:hypothetical protein